MTVYEAALRLIPDVKDEVGTRAGVHAGIGHTYAQQGRWAEAASAFHRSVECDPSNHEAWYKTATLDLAAGDMEAYQRTCGQILQRFGKTDDVMDAERTAKVCSLTPLAVGDAGVVTALAEFAVKGTEGHDYYRYFSVARGLVAYRAGRYDEALDWLERIPPKADGTHWDAMSLSILAMTNHRLGRPEEAVVALLDAKAIISAKMPDGSTGSRFDASDWHDWLHCQILFREAEKLLNAASENSAGASTRAAGLISL
jgi:tetratricopeptide (TPR) repeat protein